MQYNFSITGLIKEGFKRTKGAKGTIFGAFIVYVIIAGILSAILEIFFPSEDSLINGIIGTVLSAPIIIPIMTGLTFLGINYARGLDINVPSIFDYYKVVMPLSITYLLMYILIILGLILLVLPGVYLAIAYSFAYPLVVDKGLSPWEAMELSRKTITKQWFKFFGLAILSSFIVIVSIIPLGIGLIWSIPTIYITYGLLYHHLFDEDNIEEV